MHSTRCSPLMLLPMLLVACGGQPVAPDRVGPPRFAATHGDFTTTFSFVDDPADCIADSKVGEIVLFTGQITYVERTTTTSSGNVDVSWYFNYDPAVRLVGQSSGRVWMIDATSTHPTGHNIVHGDGLSSQSLANEFYTSASGGHLHLNGNYHLTQNANGTITATRDFVWQCDGG